MKAKIQINKKDDLKGNSRIDFSGRRNNEKMEKKLIKMGKRISQSSSLAKRSYSKKIWKGKDFQMNKKLKFLMIKSLS